MRHRTPGARRRVAPALVLGSTLLLAACSDAQENGQNPFNAEGPAAEKINDLFIPVIVVAGVVAVFILGAVLLVAFRFRYREGKNENPKQIHGSTPLEIGWTIAPALLLAVIAVPTIATIFDLAEAPAGENVLEVEVVGKQWWWEFNYPEQPQVRRPIVTANELVIPTGEPVRARLTACSKESLPDECNVIHSFWVPEIAPGKVDVIPGRENAITIEADRPGTYLGQCAEYCGLSHANMRFRVIAKPPAEFEQWVREQQRGPAVPFIQEGPEGEEEPVGLAQDLVLNTFQCTNCHIVDDSSKAQYGPNLTHLASRTTFASGYYKLTRDNLIDWVLDAPSLIPMQSETCRVAPPAPDNDCVGMPSFTKDTPKGMPVMTRDQAEQIADYLLALR